MAAAGDDLIAHGWALEQWHFGAIYTVDEYIRLQTRHVLNALVVHDGSWEP